MHGLLLSQAAGSAPAPTGCRCASTCGHHDGAAISDLLVVCCRAVRVTSGSRCRSRSVRDLRAGTGSRPFPPRFRAGGGNDGGDPVSEPHRAPYWCPGRVEAPSLLGMPAPPSCRSSPGPRHTVSLPPSRRHDVVACARRDDIAAARTDDGVIARAAAYEIRTGLLPVVVGVGLGHGSGILGPPPWSQSVAARGW